MARPGLLHNLQLEKPNVTTSDDVITIRYKEYMYRLYRTHLSIYRGTLSFIISFGDVIGVDLFVPYKFIFVVRCGLLTEVLYDGTVVLIKPLDLSGTFDQRIWQLIHECLIRHFYRLNWDG